MEGQGLIELRRKLGEKNAMAGAGHLGLPQLRADQLIPPTPFVVTESAEIFRPLTIPRPARLWVPGEHRRLRAIPNAMKFTGAQHIARKLYVPSVSGILDLSAAGEWWINAEIVTSEGTEFEAIYTDAVFGIPDAETDDSWSLKFDPRIFQTPPAPVAVSNASGLKLAARVGRRFLYVRAGNFAGGCTKVTFAFTTPVVSLQGFHLEDGDEKFFDALEGISEQAVYAVTDQGTADLYFVEAV